MKFGLVNHGGRAGICMDDRVYDLERDSGGTLTADPMHALAEWEAVLCWAEDLGSDVDSQPLDPASLLAPVPAPQKIFGVGLNYHDHAREAGLDVPKSPLIFTKFPSDFKTTMRLTKRFQSVELNGGPETTPPVDNLLGAHFYCRF